MKISFFLQWLLINLLFDFNVLPVWCDNKKMSCEVSYCRIETICRVYDVVAGRSWEVGYLKSRFG